MPNERVFVVEDERHSSMMGAFQTFDAAFAELRCLATLPWDEEPNQAPCAGWEGCGRHYEVVEYDVSVAPWRTLGRWSLLTVDAGGPRWTGMGPVPGEDHVRDD